MLFQPDRRGRGLSVSLLICLLALGLLPAATGGVSAQGADEGHPAHIHVGTCDDLGEIAYALSNIGPGTIRNGVQSTNGKTVGQTEDIHPVDVSVTTVNAPLSTITSTPHAINIHESVDKIQNYIACGNIGGTQYGNTLIIGVGQRNETGYTGIAVLRADGDQTVVTVYLEAGAPVTVNAEQPADGGTPSAGGEPTAPADTPEAATGAEEAVSISNFAFSPDTLEIKAGTTVTWTNEDSAPHTVTADDGAFDAGRLDQGQTFSFTFDTPGTFTYHCDFHPSMKAKIVVT